MSEVGRQRMTSRILADIVQCHVHFFHLTVSIQVAFFLAHKQAWGPTCLWSRAAEASGWAATSHTVSCRRWRRPRSSAARHQSNPTAPGCFIFFCSTCPLAILHQSCSSQAPCGAQKGGAADRCRDHLLQSWLQEPTDGADPCLRSSMQTFVMLFEFVTHILQTSWRHCSDVVCHIYFIWTTPGCEISNIGCCTADTIWCGFTAILVSIELHRWQASWGPEPPDAATSLRILGWIHFKIPKFALLHIQKFVLQQHACNDNSLRDSNQTTTWVQLRRIRSCRNRYFLARAFGYFSDKSLLRHLRVVFRGFVCRFIYIYIPNSPMKLHGQNDEPWDLGGP